MDSSPPGSSVHGDYTGAAAGEPGVQVGEDALPSHSLSRSGGSKRPASRLERRAESLASPRDGLGGAASPGLAEIRADVAHLLAGAPGAPSPEPRAPRTAARPPSTMSKLGKFFKGGGSSKSRAAPSAQEALARLRETEEMLGKKQEYLEGRIQRELSLARKHGTWTSHPGCRAVRTEGAVTRGLV